MSERKSARRREIAPCSAPTDEAASGSDGKSVRGGLRARFFAWMMARGAAHEAHLYAEHKATLFGHLPPGTDVLEIGAGAGVNASFLVGVRRWIALEPNIHFHEPLREVAARHKLPLEIVVAEGERLPLPDASVDVVVSTLVLCSVTDPTAVLAEVRRVLRPGGRFLFMEHVAAPRGTGLRRLQRLVRRLWRWVADGCHLDRRTETAIRNAGFESVEVKHFTVPLRLVRPHILGVAAA